MKRLLTFCVVVFVLTFSCLVQAGTIASDPDYKASTNLSIGALVTIREGTQWELTGYEISEEFQLNLLYQAGILDSDIDNINHYWDPMGWTYNFGDNDEYVLNVSAMGGLKIYEYDGMQETTGGPETKWTLTGWHQTILAGDIIDNGDGTITLQVLPIGTYRPFVGDPPVNNVEVFDGDVDCEVLGYTFTGSIGDIGDGSVLSVILVPAPTEVWVDDDFDNSTPGWGTTHFNMIQDGIDAVADGGKVRVIAGIYAGALLDKNVEIKGENGAIIDDGPLHPAGLTFGFHVLDGSDGATISHLVFMGVDLAIYHYASAGDLTIEHCTFIDSIQAITNWGGSGWQISHNDIIDLRTSNGGGIGILVGDRSGGVVEENVISHNTITGVLQVDPDDGGGYDGSGIVLYADFRYSWDGTEEIKNNRIVKNKVELESDTPEVVDVWACELTDSRDDEELDPVIFDNSVGFNDFRKTEKQILLTPENLDEVNDISRNLGDNRGHGLHPSAFGF